MALTARQECGAQVSDQAMTCPRCGYPIPKRTREDLSRVDGERAEPALNTLAAWKPAITVWVIGAVFIFLVLLTRGCSPNSVSVEELLQDPRNFKGQTIRLLLYSDQLDQIRPGQIVTFRTFSKNMARLKIDILIPHDVEVVPATYGAGVVVTFCCETGSLHNGNTATRIRWPRPFEKD